MHARRPRRPEVNSGLRRASWPARALTTCHPHPDKSTYIGPPRLGGQPSTTFPSMCCTQKDIS